MSGAADRPCVLTYPRTRTGLELARLSVPAWPDPQGIASIIERAISYGRHLATTDERYTEPEDGGHAQQVDPALFCAARALLAHPAIAPLNPSELKGLVQVDLMQSSRSDLDALCLRAWPLVEWPDSKDGRASLSRAIRAVGRPARRKSFEDQLVWLQRFCLELQRQHGRHDFALPVHIIERALGYKKLSRGAHGRGSRLRRALEASGFLIRTRKPSRPKRVAAHFVVAGWYLGQSETDSQSHNLIAPQIP